MIHEQTEVLGLEPRPVVTDHAAVGARRGTSSSRPRATARRCAQTRRRVLPLYSLMIATEPLPDAVWDEIGIAHGQTFTDYRHLLIYGQRTADNRFAFGGRGARYHWGSAIRADYDRVAARLRAPAPRRSRDLFPAARATPRSPTAGAGRSASRATGTRARRYDPATRHRDGGRLRRRRPRTTNLAGRTLADLLTGADTALTRLPWVGHRSPNWEPEPLRFLGANAGLVAMTAADAEERATGRRSLVARAMAPLIGH